MCNHIIFTSCPTLLVSEFARNASEARQVTRMPEVGLDLILAKWAQGLPELLNFQQNIEISNEIPRLNNFGNYLTLQRVGREAVRAKREMPMGWVCPLDPHLHDFVPSQHQSPSETCVTGTDDLSSTLVLITLLCFNFKPRHVRNNHVFTKQQSNWCRRVKHSFLRTQTDTEQIFGRRKL